MSSENENACCAHSRVHWAPIDNGNGTASARWMCQDCGTKFWPAIPADIAAEQDRREKLARAEARLEEWLNAPMHAWPDQTSYPQEWGNELRQHQQNRIFALQAELASLRAPAEPPKEKP